MSDNCEMLCSNAPLRVLGLKYNNYKKKPQQPYEYMYIF